MLRGLATAVAGLLVWPRAARAEEGAASEDTAKAQADSTAYAEVSLSLSSAKALATIGGSAVVTLNGRTILLARDSHSSVRAFESRCTHKQVTLKYDHKNRRLACPAHGSRFDLDGKVTKGPAKLDLATYPAFLRGDEIVVRFPA